MTFSSRGTKSTVDALVVTDPRATRPDANARHDPTRTRACNAVLARARGEDGEATRASRQTRADEF